MKRLFLLRHAKSSWEAPALADERRPLNRRGERDAPEMGRRLAARGVAPDLFVTSPAVRARETARLVARELGYPAGGIAREPRIYEATPGELLAVVQGTDDAAGSLLLVGHNPGITGLARLLVRGFREELPTAGLVAVDLPVRSWTEAGPGEGRLAFFDTPKRPG